MTMNDDGDEGDSFLAYREWCIRSGRRLGIVSGVISGLSVVRAAVPVVDVCVQLEQESSGRIGLDREPLTIPIPDARGPDGTNDKLRLGASVAVILVQMSDAPLAGAVPRDLLRVAFTIAGVPEAGIRQENAYGRLLSAAGAVAAWAGSWGPGVAAEVVGASLGLLASVGAPGDPNTLMSEARTFMDGISHSPMVVAMLSGADGAGADVLVEAFAVLSHSTRTALVYRLIGRALGDIAEKIGACHGEGHARRDARIELSRACAALIGLVVFSIEGQRRASAAKSG